MIGEPEFGGRIGRTYQDSEPWWPDPPAGTGGPNVVLVVLDDTGFAHFGCYGSTLTTPNIDALAGAGLRYTGFHTTALCSPSRACLLTGRNHHAVGMRGVSNWNSGFPHMRGGITSRAATVAELLRDHGYATFAAGKWHLAPMLETSAAGPHAHWPLQKGFDRYYGFLQGETDQFYPELTHDNHHVDPPGGPEDGYHVSEDIVDRSMGWVRDLVSVRPDRPFFLYLAFGATHAPHQAPASYRERWRGAFDEGYDVMDEFSFFNAHLEDVDDLVANRLDDIGGPHSHSNYPWGWAQAGNSPLRWYKQNTYGGGVRDPFIVHWPGRIDPLQAGAIRTQFCHAVDVAATILDVTGAPAPEQFRGQAQIPLHGRSIAPTFGDPTAASPRSVQYFEQMGHRGIYADGWKATTYHRQGDPFDADEWSLFHLDEDFSECHDLSADHPAKLAEMIDLWWSEAGAMGVLPLDDRTIELFGGVVRPGTPHASLTYEYRPPISHIPADASPLLGARPWTITADVTVGEGGADGVLYARGSHNVGHVFFLHDGKLQFDYNALGSHHRAAAPVAFAPGHHSLSARLDRNGPGALVTIGADGEDLASVEVPWVARMLGSTGMDLGRDSLSTVVDDYQGPHPFTGRLERVVVEVRSRRTDTDVAAEARTQMAWE